MAKNKSSMNALLLLQAIAGPVLHPAMGVHRVTAESKIGRRHVRTITGWKDGKVYPHDSERERQRHLRQGLCMIPNPTRPLTPNNMIISSRRI